MSTLTILLPDDTAQRLKSLAQSRCMSMNKLVEQLSAHALSAWDTEHHFRGMLATEDVRKDWPCWTGWMRLTARHPRTKWPLAGQFRCTHSTERCAGWAGGPSIG